MRYSTDYMRPSESFSRGFWGGIGFFCGFMVLNLVVMFLIVAGAVWLGAIGTAASEWQPPQKAASERVERVLPARTPVRRGQAD